MEHGRNTVEIIIIQKLNSKEEFIKDDKKERVRFVERLTLQVPNFEFLLFEHNFDIEPNLEERIFNTAIFNAKVLEIISNNNDWPVLQGYRWLENEMTTF
jgi:hypothetical protein